MTEYWVPGEHRQILNIDRLDTNMHNSNSKEFAWVKAQGINLSFGWGSIQEWGCIQADTVFYFPSYIDHEQKQSKQDQPSIFVFF